MKESGKLLAIIVLISTSCNFEQKKYTKSEFLIMNKCKNEIEVYSSAMVSYQDGPQEGHLHDKIPSNRTQSLRVIHVTDSFNIKDIFTKLEIYKASVKSSYNVWDKNKWTKDDSLSNFVSYTLVVDSTFFIDNEH